MSHDRGWLWVARIAIAAVSVPFFWASFILFGQRDAFLAVMIWLAGTAVCALGLASPDTWIAAIWRRRW